MVMTEQERLALYGTAAVDAAPAPLGCRGLTATLYRAELRRITFGNVEFLRGVGLALGDRGVPAELELEHTAVTADDGRFAATVTGGYRSGGMRARVEIEISGDSALGLRYRVRLAAEGGAMPGDVRLLARLPAALLTNRTIALTLAQGAPADGTMPSRPAVGPLFAPAAGLRYLLAPGTSAALGFSSPVIVTDRRNWMDAEFAAISVAPPPGGAVLEYALSVDFTGYPPGAIMPEKRAVAEVSLVGAGGDSVPAVGLDVADVVEAPGAFDVAALVASAPAYLYCRVSRANPLAPLVRLAELARARGAPVTLGLAVDPGVPPAEQIRGPAAAAREAGLAPAWVVAAPPPGAAPAGAAPDAGYWEALYAAVRAAFPDSLIGSGSFGPFAALNAWRPPAQPLDFVTFSVCPSWHAADNATVIENLAALSPLVTEIYGLARGKPLRLGPSGLGARAGAEGDSRDRALFGAAWCVGFLAEAARLGVEAVTLRVPTRDAPTLPPITHVVRGLAAGAGRRLIHSTASRGGTLDRLIFETAAGPEAWLVNLADEPQAVVIKGGPGTRLRLQVLDLGGTAGHERDPGEWPERVQAATEPIALGAYAVARVSGWH
ncbi:MAG: hypothetical protein FJX56_07020 [Alphaproteobacteria bacterium]|nr:hypothetical protein [Alphaproteobacteria bacterium]